MMNTNTMVLIEQESVEWEVVSAYLALCSRTARVRLVSLWHIQIGNLLNQFNKKATDKSVLPCWVGMNELGSQNTAQDVCRRGFELTDEGLLVHYGSLHFPEIPTFLFKSQQPVPADGRAATSPYSPHQHARDPIFQQWHREQESMAEKSSYEIFLCDVCQCSVRYVIGDVVLQVWESHIP
eukprot:Gregarina_sp_Poly_1__5865@NODE_308_length_9647_cov_165_896660_g265_i0_p6_GENE_NODE_308_length_9647_cov_165_896660_g265_i0NODE_308_length_9647_cov_165_896660_g265_i0_p6_ORF_typecomplete_len181_score21_50_NODE_308_length_9647_cov_165_896660_g265_i089169458